MDKAKYDDILDLVGVAVAIVESKTGKIISANLEMESLTHFSKAELMKKKITDFFAPVEAQKFRDLLALRTAEKNRSQSGMFLRQKKHSRINVSVSVSRMDDSDLTMITIQDNTYSREAELEVAEAQTSLESSDKFESLGEMAASIAHEVNNPLAIIQGLAEVLNQMSEDEKTTEVTSQIQSAVRRVAEIVKGLRTFSRKNDRHEIAKRESHRTVVPIWKKEDDSEKEKNDSVVLIVDDEPEIRSLLKLRFDFKGYKTLEASNGREAFKILETQDVDIVLSDICMPKGDGLWLLENMNRNGHVIPLVFVTGTVNMPLPDLHELGAQAIFFKPIDLPALEQQVGQILLSRRFRWRRRQLRIDDKLNVVVRLADGEKKEQLIRNVGSGGVFIAWQGELPAVGTSLALEFSVCSELGGLAKILAKGVVRWRCDQASTGREVGVGVALTEYSEASKKYFFEYVNYLCTTPEDKRGNDPRAGA